MENKLTINNISIIKSDNNECSFSILYSSDNPFLCKSCKKYTPIIDFKNNNLENIFYKCKCSFKSEYGFDNVIDSDLFYYYENKKDSFDKYMKCNKHNDKDSLSPYHKYIGYCNNHEENFCKLCINEHLNEDIIYFDNLKFEINENIKNLIKIYKLDENIDNIDILDFSFTEIKNIRILLCMIINDYWKYPNYNLIKNIKRIYEISQLLIKSENNSLNELNVKKILNIKFMHELDELDKLDDYSLALINSINLKQINFFDIN